MVIKTLRISEQTHQKITNLAVWGEPLEQVIIELLNKDALIKENLAKFLDFLLEKEDLFKQKTTDALNISLLAMIGEVKGRYKELFEDYKELFK